MAATSQVSDRGQITIDKSLRKRLGVKPGMIAYQRVVEGWKLEIIFLPAPHRRSQFGVFHQEGEPPVTSEEIEGAVRAAVVEKWKRIDEGEA